MKLRQDAEESDGNPTAHQTINRLSQALIVYLKDVKTMNIGARLLKNLFKSPFRLLKTFQRLLDPAYRLQHRANIAVGSKISKDRIQLLEQNPGQSSDRECRLLAHLAMEADDSGSIVEIGTTKEK
ncbi:MAG: hypothetical protein R3C11_16565 [Planctomycetaceae bacterium]